MSTRTGVEAKETERAATSARFLSRAGRRRGCRRRKHSFAAAAALAVLATASPSFAFRSAADTPGFEGTARVRWHGSPLKYEVHDDMPPGISAADVQTAAESALARWSEAAGGRIEASPPRLTRMGAVAGDSRNTITFVFKDWNQVSQDTDAAAATDVSYVRTGRGEWAIEEADIYLNAEGHAWVAAAANSAHGDRDLDSVLTHELGHLLGLMHPCEIGGAEGAPDCSDHPELQDATMYPVYSPAQSTLASDDIAGINFLYGPLNCDLSPCAEDEVCSEQGCRQRCDDQLCEANEYCTVDGCLSELDRPGNNKSCTRSNCAETEQCADGQCVAQLISAGDVCQQSQDCASGICAEQGFCLDSCSDCRNGSCSLDGAQRSCTAARFPLGSDCQRPEDCLGQQCLRGARQANICTRECSGAPNSCPDGWTCNSVDETMVCAPTQFGASGGGSCSLVAMNHATSGQLSASLLTVSILVFTGRFRRRTPRPRRTPTRRRSQC